MFSMAVFFLGRGASKHPWETGWKELEGPRGRWVGGGGVDHCGGGGFF